MAERGLGPGFDAAGVELAAAAVAARGFGPGLARVAGAAAVAARGLGPGLRRMVFVAAFARGLRVVVALLADVEARALGAAFGLALLVAAMNSSLHLPDITRWAASATASAISVPSFDALVIIAVAALDALSAASIPASRILRRAPGEAASAAAAAVSAAASISRLSAAFASLSIVVSLPLLVEPDFPPEPRVVDLAMRTSREVVEGKTVHRRNGSVKRKLRAPFTGLE